MCGKRIGIGLKTKRLIMCRAGIISLEAQVKISKCFSLWSRGFELQRHCLANRLNKSGSMLSQTEGQMLIYMYITNVHGLEQLVHFPTREKNTLDLILTSLPY